LTVEARARLLTRLAEALSGYADHFAGLIGEDEARKRRATIAQEADFYGSMDGASKFVRGDAVAGILILFINIIGGLIIGVIQHDMSAGDAAKTYTLLTIGDGLVAQIPALIISTAAGIVVSRVGTEEDMSQQLIGQLFQRTQVLQISGAVLALLGLIPGMPHIAFLLLAAAMAGGAYAISKRVQTAKAEAAAANRLPGGYEAPYVTKFDNLYRFDDALARSVIWLALWDMTRDGEISTSAFTETGVGGCGGGGLHACIRTGIAALRRGEGLGSRTPQASGHRVVPGDLQSAARGAR
jgi:flagellar biosynthesis protein FlhA